MIPFLALVKKELGSVFRDRTIIIAILIQLFIASFSSALLLGMFSLYDADTILRYSGSWIKDWRGRRGRSSPGHIPVGSRPGCSPVWDTGRGGDCVL